MKNQESTIFFGRLTSKNCNLNKIIKPDPDNPGRIIKEASADSYGGSHETIEYSESLEFFGDWLANNLESNQCLTLGVVEGSKPGDTFKVVMKGRERPGEISRTKDFIKPVLGANSMGLVDIDIKNILEAFDSPEEVLNVLLDALPALAVAEFVLLESVNGALVLPDGNNFGAPGYHGFVRLADSNVLAVLKDYVQIKLQLAGLFSAKRIETATGPRVLVSYVLSDPAVFEASRPVFEALPTLTGGLQHRARNKVYQAGRALTVEDLFISDEERVRASEILEAAKDAAYPDRKNKGARRGDRKGKAPAAAEPPVKNDAEGHRNNTLFETGCSMRARGADFEEILSALTELNGSFSKPLASREVETCARSAAGYPPGEKEQTWQEKLEANFQLFNATHAHVMMKGEHRVMRNYSADTEFIKQKSLELTYQNKRLKVGEQVLAGGGVKSIYKNAFIAWATDPRSRSFVGGVQFAPNKMLADNVYNLWQGFGVVPARNDVLIEAKLTHIREIICAGSELLNTYVLNWLAYSVQHPDRVQGSMLVLRGKKGVGKGLFWQMISGMWGCHAYQITGAEQLTGRFNGHLEGVCALFVDEGYWGGDKRHESLIKGYVTEPLLHIERKGIDGYSVPNYLKIIMATNCDYAVPASSDERRYCVLDVSDVRRGDRNYFDNLAKICNNIEARAAMLAYLLERDITGFHTGDIPETIGLEDQRRYSLHSVGRWLVDCLTRGWFVDESESILNGIPAKGMREAYLSWINDNRVSAYDIKTECDFAKYLSEVFGRKRIKSGRFYKIFDIDVARTKFAEFEKIGTFWE